MKKFKNKLIFTFILIIVVICAGYIVHNLSYGNQNEYITPVNITIPMLDSQSVPDFSGESSKACALIDAKSGALLYGKNENVQLPMASTTKIMTALVVLENMSLDSIVSVFEKAVGIEGTSIYLFKDEKISVENLLYGLLLNSGNDAASALAIACSGTIEEFVMLMNEKAKSLGLINTHFTNPHGLHDSEHYTTAYELSLITSEALENEKFKEIVSCKNKYMTTSSGTTRYFKNHNRLLWSYPYATGVKTGYTMTAGRCLVTSAQNDNETYIAVTLSDRNDWNDHKNLLDYAFENYDSIEIADQNVFNIHVGSYVYRNDKKVFLTVPSGYTPFISYKTKITPVSGKVEYFIDQTKVGQFWLKKYSREET